MKYTLRLIILIINFSLISLVKSQDTDLEHVTIFFRHGARSPVRSYPNNPLKQSYWDKYGGMNTVTPTGLKQCYDLGVYVKTFYKNFLNEKYDKSKLYARSTDTDRTLVSALTFLSGLYQPNSDLQWNPSVNPNWLPIPVHTVSSKSDSLSNYNLLSNSECHKYNEYRNEFIKSDEYKKITVENDEFVQEVKNYSGISDIDLYKIWILSDNALNEIIEKVKQNTFITENFQKIIDTKDYGYTVDYGSFERARFFGANLLEEILYNLENKILGKIKYQMAVYSNHDTNLSGLSMLLNFTWPLKEIPYASAFAFELRKSNLDQSYYVQVLFKENKYGSKNSEFTPVKLAKCKNILCTIDEFRNLAKPSFFQDYKKECAINGGENDLKIYNTFFQIIVFGFILSISFKLFLN